MDNVDVVVTQKVDRPYGSWESPLTSKAMTAGSVEIISLQLRGETLYWLEGRPQEGGRNVLCKDDNQHNNAIGEVAVSSSWTNHRVVDVSPKESNIRTRVHEYGGGAIVMMMLSNPCHPPNATEDNNTTFYYSEFTTQRLMKLTRNNNTDETTMAVSPITPPGDRYRFADGVLMMMNSSSSNNNNNNNPQLIYCIREDHQENNSASPKDVVNEIVSIDPNDGSMNVIATGNDFYAAPRLSPDGTKLAYLTWNHSNMPWDATELRVVTLNAGGGGKTSSSSSNQHECIAGSDGDTSILQPLWHPITGQLFYISDESGYYNIYRANHNDNNNGKGGESILPLETDFGGTAPGWYLGQQGFNFLPDGRLVAQYKRNGCSVLLVANVTNSGLATDVNEYTQDDGLPMQLGRSIYSTTGSNDLYFIGGSPSIPTSIYQWNLNTKGPAKVIVCSSSSTVDQDYISIPKLLEFPTTLGTTAFGYYYAPCNKDYNCTTEEQGPPLLVKAHGGPTACAETTFDAGIQFWTSRGFAVLDVDYGGSTGYGREYRRRLRKSWGIVDIDDVCNGAKYLVEQKLADGERLCIDGGSAGGYTTLGALAFRNVFQAGCSLYGVGDLGALAADTHKFESRYLDGLVGPYPQDEIVYKQRSPIESVDTLSCPILLLQGDEDEIVPPNQAILMHEALLKKGIPTCLKIYKGEQHGFRKAENIEDAIDSELAFYGRVFGIDIPNAIDLTIDNL